MASNGLTFPVLREITNNFSEERKLGQGPHGVVYRAQDSWRKRLQETWSGSSLKAYCQQVKRCTEIALDCMENRHKRPNMVHILNRLNEMEELVDLVVGPRYKVVQRSRELSVRGNSTFRMDDMHIELSLLESIVDRCEKPSNLKLPLLKHITKNFSDELKIGHGGCGVVYKGILSNGTVAVKKLFNSHTIDDVMFHREVKSMMVVQHQNIVRFLGYCSHTEEQVVEMAGIIHLAQIRERLLCFEYISNGSLENHLTDQLRGLEWNTRYQIIKGICEGLQHLNREKHIIHMDLKPANILLDDNLMPKITDFGLSRLDEKSQTTSKERLISLGYCAPEYHYHGKMSAKSDIYSLGVIIIELLTGSKEQPSITKLNKIDTTDAPDRDSPESTSDQMTPCLEDMLGVEPLDMHLSFELNKELSCSIELINDTDDRIAFRISMTSLRQYNIQPSKGIVPARSKCSVTIALQPQERPPPHSCCRDECSVQSTRVDGSLTATDITGDMFNELEPGKVVDNVNFFVVLDMPPVHGD
ncbi:uncharacterized protein C2845_PM05G17120 [Panicum miliaceum]|uniref:Protein kinase domain-containing protein n=1 Tax=Panicum miliaceum TaxID=4540 RepID=A0A3L6SZY0_PANMI|nr:uncharacterized protein C2845_PM05G17120 [Panicum miliaceum]